MELRSEDLESELFKMKILPEDYNKAEWEIYKQLYLEELRDRKSLENSKQVGKDTESQKINLVHYFVLRANFYTASAWA